MKAAQPGLGTDVTKQFKVHESQDRHQLNFPGFSAADRPRPSFYLWNQESSILPEYAKQLCLIDGIIGKEPS